MECYRPGGDLWMGPAGAGQLTKMVNQICIAGLVQALGRRHCNFAEEEPVSMRDKVVEVISREPPSPGRWTTAAT